MSDMLPGHGIDCICVGYETRWRKELAMDNPVTDTEALAEMAAWLKGWCRSVAVYNRPDESVIEIWANQASPKGMHIMIPHDYSGRGPTIAEAWAALKNTSGFPK